MFSSLSVRVWAIRCGQCFKHSLPWWSPNGIYLNNHRTPFIRAISIFTYCLMSQVSIGMRLYFGYICFVIGFRYDEDESTAANTPDANESTTTKTPS